MFVPTVVIPAKAGIPLLLFAIDEFSVTPAFAGVTEVDL